MKNIILLFAFFTLCLHCAGCSKNKEEITSASLPIAENFTLESTDNSFVTLSDANNNGVILVFYATWCPLCRSEIPELKELYSLAQEKNITMHGITIKQSKKLVERYEQKNMLPYTTLLDMDRSVAMSYNLTGFPTIVGINKNGEIVFRKSSLPENKEELINMFTE
jgi:peroxiredoxin